MLYLCDPRRNTKCSKESCWLNGGDCRCTTNVDCAERTVLDGEEGVWAVWPEKATKQVDH